MAMAVSATMFPRLSLVTPPASSLLTLDEVREDRRLSDPSYEQALLERLIAAATAHLDGAQGILGRALVTQTWRADYPASPGTPFVELPLQPILGVDSIVYADASGNRVTMAPSEYAVQPGERGGIERVGWRPWPQTGPGIASFQVTFRAGYGAVGADVPEPIRKAATIFAGTHYEYKEAVAVGTIVAKLPFNFESLISPYRRRVF